MVKKVIITGAKGFVGSHLMPFLQEKGFQVASVSRSGGDFSWEAISDLDSPYEAFIHLAGKAHDVKGASKDQVYTEVNFHLTQTAFNAFKNSHSNAFFFFSSVKAVASEVSGVLEEDSVFEVDNPYGKSKRMAEEWLLNQPLEPHQKLYIIRPCMIHGPGNKGNLNLLYSMAKKGIPFPFASFHNERSLLGIDNAKELVLGMMEKSPESGVYNFSDDGFISTTKIYELMGEVVGKKPTLWKVPKSAISIIGKFGDILPLPIDSLKIKKLTENYRVSNHKIKKALGWDSMPHSLSDNLKNTLKSFNS